MIINRQRFFLFTSFPAQNCTFNFKNAPKCPDFDTRLRNFTASSRVCDRNSYWFLAWNFRKLIYFQFEVLTISEAVSLLYQPELKTGLRVVQFYSGLKLPPFKFTIWPPCTKRFNLWAFSQWYRGRQSPVSNLTPRGEAVSVPDAVRTGIFESDEFCSDNFRTIIIMVASKYQNLIRFTVAQTGNSLQYFPRSWFTGYIQREFILDYYIEIFPR